MEGTEMTIQELSQMTPDEMRRHGVTSPIEEPNSFDQKFGIGAQDQDPFPRMVRPAADTGELLPFTSGHVYALAIKRANEMRHRAFRDDDPVSRPEWPRMHAALYLHPDRGSSTYTIEREQGIPAW